MKTSRRFQSSNLSVFCGLVLASALMGAGVAWSQTTVIPPAAPTPNVAEPHWSVGVGEVIHMVNAKVDVEVIKAYVHSSPIAYNPSATEIIALEQHGVSDDIITAMLRRGGELRAQQMTAAQQQYQASMTQPPSPGGVNPYDTTQTQQPYAGTDTGVDTTGAYPDYSYTSPTIVTSGWWGGWPWWWGWGWWGGTWCPGIWWNGCFFHGGFGFNHGFNHGFNNGFAHGFAHGFNHGFNHGVNTGGAFAPSRGFAGGRVATSSGFHGGAMGFHGSVGGFHGSMGGFHGGGGMGGGFHGGGGMGGGHGGGGGGGGHR